MIDIQCIVFFKMLYRKYIFLLFLLFFSLSSLRIEAQGNQDILFNHFEDKKIESIENPLLQVVGKTFGEYHFEYKNTTSNLLHVDSLSRVKLVELFKEASAIDKSGEWKLLENMVVNTVRFYESRKGGYSWSDSYTAENYSENMVAIANLAEKKGFHMLKIFALFNAAEGYQIFLQNYERAFTYYLAAASEAEALTTKEFPPRPNIFIQVAGMFFLFREYKEAIIYYQKVTDDPDVRDNYYNSLYPALNGLGLCYRYAYNDYERSNSYFNQILQETKSSEYDWSVWEGIAEGNIGYNYYLRGDYDSALLWLIPIIDKITRHEDFSFVLNRAVNIADIYLIKKQPTKAKEYINLAQKYFVLLGHTDKKSSMYEVLFKYYMEIGDKEQSILYYDSTLMAKNRENDTYSGLVLRHIEQQMRSFDQKIHKQEIQSAKLRNSLLKQIIIIVSVALIIILTLLWILLIFYQRKRSAYRELVRQSQNWAGIAEETASEEIYDIEKDKTSLETEDVGKETDAFEYEPDIQSKNDKLTMKKIDKIMVEKELYKRTDFSLDLFAAETGINRYYISSVLNRCTEKNFNTYVNEYRIKEAIRIMSEPKNKDLTIDKIASDSGFNDRQNFHRVFKKKTGISPSDFRKIIGRN